MANLNIGTLGAVSFLKTDPDVMRAKAAAVQVKIREMQASFEALENTIRKTQTYWIGEAGDAHRDFFNKTKEEREEILKRLMEDVTDLNQMAAQYSSTEKEVAALSEELPSDVII